MKKIILTLMFCFFASLPVFAQNNIHAMNFLMVNSLMEYGQTLYDRGNLNEACAVFNHVLIYDPHQAQALHYLKEMGHAPLDADDTTSLKEAIAAKKQIIAKLQDQITEMRASIAAESAE